MAKRNSYLHIGSYCMYVFQFLLMRCMFYNNDLPHGKITVTQLQLVSPVQYLVQREVRLFNLCLSWGYINVGYRL